MTSVIEAKEAKSFSVSIIGAIGPDCWTYYIFLIITNKIKNFKY